MKLENEIQAEILKYLHTLKDVLPIRVNTQGIVHQDKNGRYFLGKNAYRGVPDILVVYEGLAVFMEVKTEVGRLSPHQIIYKNKIETIGKALHYIVRSVQEAQQIVEEVLYKDKYALLPDY